MNNNRYGVEIPVFYQGYVQTLGDKDALKELERQLNETPSKIRSIPRTSENHAYADGKWSVKEVLVHVLDSERIFAYRALRFARNDRTELPGFDENAYAPESASIHRSLDSIADEFQAVRAATLSLFRNLQPEALLRKGHASGVQFSVSLIGAIIAGHHLHHMQVLEDRYGLREFA